MPDITTEDNHPVQEGDRVFNYYDMKVGDIRPNSTDQEGWFYLDHEDGTNALLNGQRICTIEFAQRKGWIPQ